jgi:hypothetical protein
MCNGDDAMTEQIIALECIMHMTPIGKELSVYGGPAGMAGWIGQLHEAFDPFVFSCRFRRCSKTG